MGSISGEKIPCLFFLEGHTRLAKTSQVSMTLRETEDETFVDVLLSEALDWSFGWEMDFASALGQLQSAHAHVSRQRELEF